MFDGNESLHLFGGIDRRNPLSDLEIFPNTTLILLEVKFPGDNEVISSSGVMIGPSYILMGK